jgi:hypothetical protein
MQSIPRRLSHCILEGEPLEQGGEYISVLDFEGRRKDYCCTCWEKIGKKVEGYFWKGRIPPKREKNLHPDQKALELFRSVEDRKLRFLLALYLQRKEQLIRRTKTLYEVPETGEVFDVEPMPISEEEGNLLVQQLNYVDR